MKIVNNEIEEIKNSIPGKKMEYCGRVCYKSDSNISDTSYIRFLQNIYKSGHLSVLEHERLIFKIEPSYELYRIIPNLKYFKITSYNKDIIVSANIRAWVENCNNVENPFYPFLQEVYPLFFTEKSEVFKFPNIKLVNDEIFETFTEGEKSEIEEFHKERTFKILCSRACSHQIVRHRVFSFSQQSQRYCNFSGEKFGHSIDFIMPIINDKKEFEKTSKEMIFKKFEDSFQEAENSYFSLIEMGARPEDARAVLPNAAATIIVMTGTKQDWNSFFKLRCDEHAQKEIRDIAFMIRDKLGENNEKYN